MKILITLLTTTTLLLASPTAKEIVQKSDEIRNPSSSFYQKGLITEYKSAKKIDSMLISIYSKEASRQFKTIVRILKPKKDKDKLILRDGNTMWLYDPNSKAIAQMSPQQRLMGESSSADVMSANFALDYKLTLEGKESIKDGSKKLRECYKISMEAISSDVSYPFVEYWVDVEKFYPIHAKFYSSNKDLLKKSYYRKFKEVMGKIRPTQVLIFDGVDTRKATKMEFADAKEKELPDFWFNKEYLSKFSEE